MMICSRTNHQGGVPLSLPDADNFDTLGFVSTRGKFLISRERDAGFGGKDRPRAGPEKTELHLVDPATGVLEPVEGEFWFPKYDLQFRPLQTASTDSEVIDDASAAGRQSESIKIAIMNFVTKIPPITCTANV